MDGYGNYNLPYQGRSPRPPMQYFTSSSAQGTPPMRPSSSTPNRSRPPRLQHGYNPSPGGGYYGGRYGSPYQNMNRPSYSPSPIGAQYTPSPVRQRHDFNTPNSSRGRGGWSPRGARGGWNHQGNQKSPIQSYFNKDMLKDPWEGMTPYLMEKTSFTTT